MNKFERAVIEAARLLSCEGGATQSTIDAVIRAVKSLEAADLPQEIGWHLVVAGDQLRSRQNGKFYPVLGSTSLDGGKTHRIKLRLGEMEKVITRPTEAEPTAIVRRGPEGKAIDVFVNVFTSG